MTPPPGPERNRRRPPDRPPDPQAEAERRRLEERARIQRERSGQCRVEMGEIGSELLKTSEPFPEVMVSEQWSKSKHPEYFRTITRNGEFTAVERKRRTQRLAKGVVVFRDVGLTFYKVQKEDVLKDRSGRSDAKDKIRRKLSKIAEFAYIADLPEDKLRSFNVLDRSLEQNAGMFIPIPEPASERIISEKEFLNHCHNAIVDLVNHKEYGCHVAAILEKCGEKEVLKLMMAIAKIESGGEPLGGLAFHRYEPHHGVFSYSLFHVLMAGPGLRARRKLNLSEGQLYHPENAAKLFLAFLIEKNIDLEKSPERFFPLLANENELKKCKELRKRNPATVTAEWPENVRTFCTFYNGAGWPGNNQRYPQVLLQHYMEAEILLSKSKVEKRWLIGHRMIYIKVGERLSSAISRAEIASAGKVILKDAEKIQLSRKIMQYLKTNYRSNLYYSTDSVGVGQDSSGVYVFFQRQGRGLVLFRL